MRRIALLVLFVLLTNVLSGCTLIGMGIGSAVPRWVPDDSPESGATVRATSDDGVVVEGVYDPNRGVTAIRRADPELPLERIAKLERRSSYLGTGAAIGGVIDTLLTIACVAALYGLSQWSLGTWPSGSWAD